MAVLTEHQRQYYAWLLTRRAAGDSVESLASTLVDSQVDLNPHQVDAALFACRNPLSRGVILADEVGLGKTIEAGLVISQRWAERRRRILIIVPANLRKQWHQELQDKFNLQGLILESRSYNALRKQGISNPFVFASGPVICSYQFAKAKAKDVKAIAWDLVVLDEAHRLRNVYKNNNVIGKTLRDALDHVHSKVLLTATPLQNSLLELYGLVSMIDDRVFGDIDSFRAQFVNTDREQAFSGLRQRLGSVCKRTLRRQVQQYVPYTARRAIVQEFTPSHEERELSVLVAEYLRRPNLNALPEGQRQLISLVLWKLLASSTHAIAGALDTMARRLQGNLDKTSEVIDLTQTLDEDYEGLDELADESEKELDSEEVAILTAGERDAISAEIAELQQFKNLATSIRVNAKGKALLIALERAFAELERLGAARKAIIFTESRRTQDYLLSLLANTPYGDGIVLFNGTNTDATAQRIYNDWLQRHAGSDRISGSKTADTRAALVEHFKERGTIMIATEAGAEGINLQFCSLVINYDLPWNPQRIEQRIGRCHRYGQKHDVVVVNFVDRSNEADARVYELLAEKFQLFEGVFGASDEVLGSIGSGVDFERRIADIYQNCRDPEEIKRSFEQLQLQLSGEISEAMVKTRRVLLENFDEEVQDKLRIRAEDSSSTRNRFERLLLDLTRAELEDYAHFDGDSFELHRLPVGSATGIALGHYELPRRAGESHLYRLGHPLAAWVIDQAKTRPLDQQPLARLAFDYAAYGTRISTLEPLRGQCGWLILKLFSVEALGNLEQHLVVSAVTADGQALPEDDPEKLLRLPAHLEQSESAAEGAVLLTSDLEQRKNQLLREINQRNMGYFEQEVAKLDAWADDLKLGLEQEIKAIDGEIKELRRIAATAATLEEKLGYQKLQRELEGKRSKLRRELFARQDEIEEERNALIDQLEAQLKQHVVEQTLFTVEWELL
ncbi:DEAD/DEAH box helicase family protein [Pseudomonas aeruginosa]|uniref:SNF2-related protein n=1 Tax=Pseudomonas aeruginosa TaxID=287 RepID=UPI001C9D9A06|nr:SNF2-related protein [Pseudomonas aeruginosa]MBY9153731.1 DEAD/DEAH box helicase family protein [Pseudomonas aeruginosa]MBY9359287.1 DEAD/DEAH box helicase family protein [Pseudomonas aeruginosa]MBY9466355.1 DEAD/DEAH box helicase family protein [Pseudomonas aeruginosa]MBY9543138.1 DEAD/DEAH box helicase family protein [Pseudomonas aeruginosa]MBY9554843.1 DEAD/DEAH box helicase family protein [Pseudomonas aeruginosa]